MYMLGCKVALEQDLSIGAIFRRKTYLDVPLILSTGPNGMYLSILLLVYLRSFNNYKSRLSEKWNKNSRLSDARRRLRNGTVFNTWLCMT
jgi:hypothetical protein